MTDKQQQWFFLRFLALWLLLALIAPIVAFCLTRSPYCFTGFTLPAYLLTLLVRRLWPPSDNETRIAIARHQSKARHSNLLASGTGQEDLASTDVPKHGISGTESARPGKKR